MSVDQPPRTYSFYNEYPTRQATHRNCQCSQDLSDVWDQLQNIKKQLRGKVSRNQFISSLSGKLSISEISSVPTLTFRNNQNISTENFAPNHHHCNTNIEDWREEWQKDIKAYIKDIRAELCNVKQVCSEADIERTQEISRWNHKIAGLREQISEFEAYTYTKADRSQLDKLFTLNELLVIEIEQAKQQMQDIHKQFKDHLGQKDKMIKDVGEYYWGREAELTKELRKQMKVFKEEIDRIMDVLELREAETQTFRDKENMSFHQYHTDIALLKEKVNKQELENSLQMRDVLTRISVVQLKESQVIRAAKQVDGMRNQIDTLRLDVHTVAERAEKIAERARQACHDTIHTEKQDVLMKVEKQLGVTCEQIMRKVIQLTDGLVSSEDYAEQVKNLKKTNQKVYELCLSNSNCIQEINNKLVQMCDNSEEEVERTEERIGKINTAMDQMVTLQKMKEILKQLVSCEELTQIAKEIDKKVSNQIKKIVDEQLKVNEVLCSETIVAKWFWSSGSFKGGNLVTWDKQVVNTLPQNFHWTQGEPVVHIASSGYYQIEMGFYSKKKPTVQLIVNGQTIVSAVNSSSYVLHHSSGKLKDVGNSEISGLTYVDYLLLPENARIGISYIGEFTGEGFLSLKRV